MRRPLATWVLVVGVLLPFVPLAGWAVSGRWEYPALVPQQLSGRGLGLLTDPGSRVLSGLLTSLTIGVVVTVLALLVGTPAGRALGLYTFRGKRGVQFLVLAPAIVPGLAVLLGTQVFFLRYGLADTVAGVVLVHLVPTVPYVTLVTASAFANLDVGYEDQARVLGAGPARVFVHVTLPLLRPALVVAGFFAFLISWSEYVLTLLIGGGTVQTLPLLLFAFVRGADLTEAAAVALLLSAPPLVLVGLVVRHLPRGHGPLIGLGRL
ncbi:MAG TPA: ABC transporter permease subunit [Actinomycetes bacterium]|nr:ABC transporter permease subunit [Actinomycetes bacterium]